MIFNKILLVTATVILLPLLSLSQQQKDSTKTTIDSSAKNPRPYKEIITLKAVTKKGVWLVHRIGDKFFFEIPDSILGRDVFCESRISRGPNNLNPKTMLGYAGDMVSTDPDKAVIRFEKGPYNKVFIRSMLFYDRSKDSSENGMYRAVERSSVSPLQVSFDIKAVSDAGSVVIDVTDFINSDNLLWSFDSEAKSQLSLGGLQKDRSYILDILSFPGNVQIKTVKTYSSGIVSDYMYTYELNTSLVLLPKNPMKSRVFDYRVGYFFVPGNEFDKNTQQAYTDASVLRWRLEPKEQDLEKYHRGELVEPKKPIVYYIDPATPKKWVPYLIQGVNDWQKAFEKAGFKNAIYAREAPPKEEDSTWSLEDARYSAIVYKPSLIQNASGPPVIDPRSGEILESHVNWYHNVMALLHDWYFIQASPNDKRARKMMFEDSLMGRLIRFVASHEIGHTLGLMHNFGASSTVPTDSLRSKAWVMSNGICPSVMDYARFNYVAQPGDSIPLEGLINKIGPYDEWAIEWGYRLLPDSVNDKNEQSYLNKWVIKKLSSDRRLWWGNQQVTDDPRTQSEDLGDDPIKSGNYGINNLKRIVPHLIEWTSSVGKGFEDLKRMYDGVCSQYTRYLLHVTRLVGGFYINYVTSDQAKNFVDFPGKKNQKEALGFLNKNLFETPDWLMDKRIYSVAERATYVNVLNVQNVVLSRLMSFDKFYALLLFQEQEPRKAYTVNELLSDLEKCVWNELPGKKPISFYRRNLQKAYITQLIISLAGGVEEYKNKDIYRLYMSRAGSTDILSIIKVHSKKILQSINAAIPYYRDEMTKSHLIDLKERLNMALDGYTSGKPVLSTESKAVFADGVINHLFLSADSEKAGRYALPVCQ